MTRHDYLDMLLFDFPEFRSFWEADDNDHRDGDQWSAHGLWGCFAEFLYDGNVDFTGRRMEKLFVEIETVVAADPNDNDVMANAMSTCFLENIAKTRAGNALRKFMGPSSRKYFDRWDTM